MQNMNEELLSYKPIDMDDVEKKIGTIPEDIKNAFEMYNKALRDINNKNEDIAIIELKKAVSIYPAFYEAMNLMGICYMRMDDEENARRMFSKIIQMDDNSIRALRYLEQMDGNVISEEKRTKVKTFKDKPKNNTSAASWLVSGFSPEKNSPYYFKYILGFVLGILSICLLWLIVPENAPISINMAKPVINETQVNSLKAEIGSLSQQLADAHAALEKTRETEKQLQDQMNQYTKWSAKLRDLQKLADEGKYREVVIEIEKNLAGLELPKAIESEIITLNNACKPKSVKQFYDFARELYNKNAKTQSLEAYLQCANEYRTAIQIIEDAEKKPQNMAEIYYYGGKAISLSQFPSKAEANQEALRCFKAVISAAPNTKIASSAQSRINDINAGKTIKH